LTIPLNYFWDWNFFLKINKFGNFHFITSDYMVNRKYLAENLAGIVLSLKVKEESACH